MLFKVRNYKTPLPWKAKAWARIPTVNEFLVAWNERLDSRWNRTACDIVIDRLLATYPSEYTRAKDEKELRAAVLSHFQHLRDYYYKGLNLSQDALNRLISQQQRRSRKREVSTRFVKNKILRNLYNSSSATNVDWK